MNLFKSLKTQRKLNDAFQVLTTIGRHEGDTTTPFEEVYSIVMDVKSHEMFKVSITGEVVQCYANGKNYVKLDHAVDPIKRVLLLTACHGDNISMALHQ
jgi:hypothetical protein